MSDKNQLPPNELKTDWKSNAKRRKTRGIISTELIQLFEIHDDLPVAAHLINIVRSKGAIAGYKETKVPVIKDGIVVSYTDIKTPIFRDPYYIEDEVFLKELENYRNTLDNKATEEEDDL